MKREGRQPRSSEHAPVNPVTGMPNTQGSEAWSPAPRASEPQGAGSPVSSASATAVSTEAKPPSSFTYATGTRPADSSASDASQNQGNAQSARVFDRFLSIVEHRVLAIVVLVLLDFAVIGLSNFILFVALLFAGYILIDRFVNARRIVTLGGIPWLLILMCGAIVANNIGPVAFTVDYLFMFCGFLAAISVCGIFFVGRAFYDYGYERGETDADRIVSRHMLDRLIDHPDDWGTVDGDFVEVEGALNRVRDRQRAAEQALRDESSRKDDLVTYLAHDLKTPLASVVGYLSLLHEAPDLPEEQRVRFTGVALDKAHRLDALIEEFFDITRFDFHDIVLTRGYVDLNLMLAQVVDEFYPTLTEQNKHARIEVPTGLTVLVDGDKMARVFNNVMKNAIAYSYEGSTILISAERVDAEVHIRFENQGDPIPAPKLKVIFEKFYRLDAARATNRGGAGLGLAIAKEIVVAHGGNIACESTPEHTVFTITLPDA